MVLILVHLIIAVVVHAITDLGGSWIAFRILVVAIAFLLRPTVVVMVTFGHGEVVAPSYPKLATKKNGEVSESHLVSSPLRFGGYHPTGFLHSAALHPTAKSRWNSGSAH